LRRQHIGQEVEVLVEGYSRLARKARGETKGQVRTRQVASPSFGGGTKARRHEGTKGQAAGSREQAAGAGERGAAELPSSLIQESEQDRGAEISADRTGQLVGRTPHDRIVVFDAPGAYIGAMVKIH